MTMPALMAVLFLLLAIPSLVADEGHRCMAGYYCPKSGGFLSCSDGHFCPKDSVRPLPIRRGYYGTHRTKGGFVDQDPCPMGAYCSGGHLSWCPAGKYSKDVLATDVSTCVDCLPGYYCSGSGNTRGDPEECGTGNFCPAGSKAPKQIRLGYVGEFVSDRALSSNEVPCPIGYYCRDGLSRPCPPGRFGDARAISEPQCSGPCAAGRYCADYARTESKGLACGNASVYCPLNAVRPRLVRDGWYSAGGFDDQTRTLESRCEAGAYCFGGRKYLCPPGTFSRVHGAASVESCMLSQPGFYVPTTGAIVPVPCGAPSLYCPNAGASTPTLVDDGFYTVGGEDPTTRKDQLIAPVGYYAVGGLLFSCPAGRYGATQGLTEPDCTGPCAPGYYCESGASRPTWKPCGAPNKYCPKQSGTPTPVETGYYTTFATTSSSCPPGRYPNETFLDVPSWSAISTPAVVSTCHLCAEGRFSTTGVSCEPCEFGVESTSDRTGCNCTRVTGGAKLDAKESLYFNATSRTCTAVRSVEVGIFLAVDAASLNETSFTRRTQIPCEQGFWCEAGLRHPCPAGTFGDGLRETRSTCAGACAEGYYCPEASTKSRQVPCGASHLYCPAGSAEPKLVDPGHYTAGESSSVETRVLQKPCPAGHYCIDGLRYPCSPGRFGSLVAANYTSAECEGPCERGHICPEASVRADAVACGAPDRVCPGGSSQRIKVPPGYYSVHTGVNADERAFYDPNRARMDAMIPCEPGYYCQGGLKHKCPHLTYGWRYFLDSPKCDGSVALGCYMPKRELPYTNDCPYECGGSDRYCPPMATDPIAVSPGYYTVGINVTRRTGQVPCPAGTYCIGGEQFPCQSGRYQQEPASERCAHLCTRGHYCPEGSRTPIRCPVGTFSVGHASICTRCPNFSSSDFQHQRCFDDPECCADGISFL